MPWRLVVFLLAMALVVLFAGFNMTNLSDISFGFYVLEDIPVFISLFIAFLFGAFLMLPFSFGRRRKKEKTPPAESPKKKKKAKKGEDDIPPGSEVYHGPEIRG